MGHPVGTRMSYAADTREDYWEDASVSLRSVHGCEGGAPSSRMQFGACVSAGDEDESKMLPALALHQTRPQRDSYDYSPCSKRRRSFPPPLALCTTLSIKEGGRFVLKEMDADRPQTFFRVQRGNGRLRLQLVLTDENEAEEDEDEESSTAEMDNTTEAEEPCEGADTRNDRASSVSENNGSRSIYADDEMGSNRVSDDDGLESMVYCDTGLTWQQEAAMDAARMEQKSSDRQTMVAGDGHDHGADIDRAASDHGMEPCESCLAGYNVELSQSTAEIMDRGDEQESLWNVDVSNQALASLSPWTAKRKMCLHASNLVSMGLSMGLAMS